MILGAVLAASLVAALPPAARAQTAGGANSQLAQARKQVADAQAEVARVKAAQAKIKARVQSKFETKEDWQAATTNLKKAQAGMEAARKPAQAKMLASPEYKALVDKRAKAQETVAALQAKGAKADAKELDKAHQEVLETGLALRKAETDLIDNDPKVADAKAKLGEAQKAMDALKEEVNQAVLDEPTYAQTETELATAEQSLEQAKESMQQQQASIRQAAQAQRQSATPSRSGRPPRSSRPSRQ
jgi:chromosome segregation ATPase